MAHRMTKEELDQQFEQFLKESVSDDSFDLGTSSTRPSVLDQLGKVQPQPVKKSLVSVPWWQDDDDSEEVLGKDEAAKYRFIKRKNIEAADVQEKSRQRQSPSPDPCKPTPKPRSKVLDKASHLDKTHLPYQETSQNTDTTDKPKKLFTKEYSHSEDKNSSADDSPSESNSPFMAEYSYSTPRQTSVILTDSDKSPSESGGSDSSNSDNGLLASGKTFRKSLRKSQPIQEVDEEQLPQGQHSENKSRGDAVIFSRDSLEPEESLVLSRSAQSTGDFTLDEKEKKSFFANLDRGSESLTDDTRLNKGQESSSSTVTSPKWESTVSVKIQDQKDSVKDNTPSPAYSEDFEDEVSEKKAEEKKPERRGMLAKVSLHDSLNDTNADHVAALVNYGAESTDWPNSQKAESARPSAPVSLYDSLNSMDGGQVAALGRHGSQNTERPNSRMAEASGQGAPGQSYNQSGASEVEALQEAYRQISHSVAEYEDDRVLESSRGPVSPATPECSAGTFRHASTAGSDLPTAEELMRAIGPESGFTYGLSLQPLIEAAGDSSAERMALDSSPLKGLNKECPEVIEPHTATLQNRHRSVAVELNRLMQEESQERPSPTVSSKGKKQQASGRSTTTRSTSSASRKAPVPLERTKKAETRPLTKPSVPSRTGRIAKPPFPQPQRKSQSQTTNRTSVLNHTHTVKGPDSSLSVSSELITSVKSFAAFLEHQMEVNSLNPDRPDLSDSNTEQTTKNRIDLVKELPAISGQDLDLKRSSLEQLSLQLAQNERRLLLREEQLQQDHSREISALKQENYILQSKLRSAEEASKKHRWSFGEASDPATEEKLRQIEREMKQQETLIQGYHLENEKLYMQMKTLQAQSKQNEEAMFTENQRLLSELAFTKEELNRIKRQKTVGSISAADQGYQGVIELMAQVQALENREEKLQEEIHRLKHEKQGLQLDLQMMKQERDLAKAQVIYTSGDKGFEIKLLEERHKEEVSALKKRLQWYAENQELLDKDAARLRAASAETQRLTEQVEKLKMEVAKRANLQEKKAKERAGEAKRVLDLERQVKEMEEILRRRHPNSLPALIYAAAAAGGQEGGSSHQHAAPQPSQTAALLERRIHRLEAELEGRDEEAKRSLRAMEQQFQRIKLQYEQQISELEQQLSERSPVPQDGLSQEPRTKAQLQHTELEQLKEVHQDQVKALKAKIASLQEQVQQARSSAETEKPSPGPSRHQRQAEAAQATRIERLTQELAAKSRTIQELHRTVERLQRERRTMLSAPRVEGSSTKHRQQHSGQAKDPVPIPVPAETFPPTLDEKDYQPRAFSGSHISEVQQENDRLMLRQEQLELQWEQERFSLQAAATQAHNEFRRIQERSAEQLASLKAEHQREVEHLVAHHALEHSSSKVAELTNQMKAQEIMVLHLREQLKELQGTKDAFAVSKLKEETLQKQLAKLLEELKQAKETHTPELRHFTSLEHKITSMDLRYQQREQELQQVIAQTRSVVEQEQQAEVTRWKKLAQGKSSELEAFRLELDCILDVLRELQRQGVVIPATQHSSASGVVFRPLRS